MSDFEKFLKRHNISVLNTQPYNVVREPSYSFFYNKFDYNDINSHISYEQQNLYTIQIPEKQLERLQQFEDQVFSNNMQLGHFNLFLTIMEQKEMETKLREQFPALQKAYENYSLMLNLCKQGEI